MIKSKIDARERALEIVKPSDFTTVEEQIECAKKIEAYLIGDAELPEVQSDTELVKAFLEVMNSELDKRCKPMPDYSEMLRAIQKGNAGISAEMPCKSENEKRMSNDKVNWEQARVDAAIAVLPKMLDWLTSSGTISLDAIEDNRATRNAVYFADALIAELKKTNEKE